jgi:hypothetical protein
VPSCSAGNILNLIKSISKKWWHNRKFSTWCLLKDLTVIYGPYKLYETSRKEWRSTPGKSKAWTATLMLAKKSLYFTSNVSYPNWHSWHKHQKILNSWLPWRGGENCKIISTFSLWDKAAWGDWFLSCLIQGAIWIPGGLWEERSAQLTISWQKPICSDTKRHKRGQIMVGSRKKEASKRPSLVNGKHKRKSLHKKGLRDSQNL